MSKHHTKIDSLKQKITSRGLKDEKIVHKGKPRGSGVRLITTIRAQNLLRRGCERYMCNVMETKTPKTSLNNIPVVQEFLDVFLEEIPGMPLPREVEFCIDFIPGSNPIYRAPYRMELAELKELKTQLDELLEKGYIRPSMSPWGP